MSTGLGWDEELGAVPSSAAPGNSQAPAGEVAAKALDGNSVRAWSAKRGALVDAHTRLLGPLKYNVEGLATAAGATPEQLRMFLRGMGFSFPDPQEELFTEVDVNSLAEWASIVRTGLMDEATMGSIIRSFSFSMDRLALWQLESLVEYMERRLGLTDTEARKILLHTFADHVPFLAHQMAYAFRRQLAETLQRMEQDIHDRENDLLMNDALPLQRALGFIDMVDFTGTVRKLGSKGLAELVQNFEFTARDVITANGGRVVKTVGDAVLYICDNVLSAANVALATVQAVGTDPALLPVRASVVWGRVVSRQGDIFGAAVNLASRLVDIAPKQTVYMDMGTGAMLAKSPRAGDFVQLVKEPVTLQGIGEIEPVELRWALPAEQAHLWEDLASRGNGTGHRSDPSA